MSVYATFNIFLLYYAHSGKLYIVKLRVASCIRRVALPDKINNEQTKYKFFILVNSSIHLATLHIPDDTYERGNPGES